MRKQALYWPDSLGWMIPKQKEYCIVGSTVTTAISMKSYVGIFDFYICAFQATVSVKVALMFQSNESYLSA